MAQATITLTFDNAQDAFGMPLYRPGDTIRGTIMVDPDEDVTCKQLYARLLWHTEGRGTRFEEKIAELALFQGELRRGIPTTYPFSFLLPDQPWSHEGHYVSVVWAVEVQIDVPWARDPRLIENFILAPDREGVADW